MGIKKSLVVACAVTAVPGLAWAADKKVDVAVVNLALIFEKYNMTKDLEALFEDRRRAAAVEAENRRSAVEAKRKDLFVLRQDSKDFIALEDEITRMEIEYEVWAAHQDRRLKTDHKRWLMRIYTNVRKGIKEIADASDIDLVLTYDELAEDAPDSIALRQQILLQKIIYFDDRIDLTQAVLSRLNEKYEQEGGPAGLRVGRAFPLDGKPEAAEAEAAWAGADHSRRPADRP